ncbi:hypothetical protein H4R18_003723 [Coemansia javaensis]|uniref:Molybdenum cofactor sulfurase n=1 Tax=Coemansia javaensis TaxID=2761396 RepID=A0A9W8H9L4_9FUNG|nr:hypothetical protein H4R18_003723 [Coemansia javaensis]
MLPHTDTDTDSPEDDGDYEYPQLKSVFLDHTGSTLCAASYVRAQADELLSRVPANPHSRHAESQWTQARIDGARERLLAFAGTTGARYAVVFTANASAAIRLAGEIAPLTADGTFCFTRESHTSVVGVRALAAERGARIRPAEFAQIDDIVAPQAARGTSLLAYPAQCNFSGDRFPLDVADRIARRYHGRRPPWWVLVDAAAYAASAPLRLDRLDPGPDFVALSMYKIFGAPTGLGALLVRRSSVPHLRARAYFGGGTVAGVAFDAPWHVPRPAVEARLEDGTAHFHGILALHHALDAHARIFGSMERVARHTQALAARARAALRALAHANGRPLCELYGRSAAAAAAPGPTVAFNVRGPDGAYVGFVEVERLAALAGISLRAGRFCNPGAAQGWLALTAADLAAHASLGVVCGDDHDLVGGRPVGALRASLGAMSSRQDVDALVAFLDRTFRDYAATTRPEPPARAPARRAGPEPLLRVAVDSVVVYPVKSCHGWAVPRGTAWEITRHGLWLDRAFVVVREGAAAPMQQKQCPAMALIRPRVDVPRSALVLEAPGHQPLEVSLLPHRLRLEDQDESDPDPDPAARVCSRRVRALRVRSDRVSAWLTSVLSVACHLACDPLLLPPPPPLPLPLPLPPSPPLTPARAAAPHAPPGSFANEAQMLLVTRESARQVEDWVRRDADPDARKAAAAVAVGPMQYRPNLVVTSCPAAPRPIEPFEELQWTAASIGGAPFDVAGPCRRCQMISIDQDSALRLREPYSTLARRMRVDGKVVFGVYLNAGAGVRAATVSVGSTITIELQTS